MTNISLTSGGRLVNLNEIWFFFRSKITHLALIFCIFCLWKYAPFIGLKFSTKAWDLSALYAAIFDWSSIQSAFLFGVYVLVLSGDLTFIRAIKDTDVYSEIKTYIRNTMLFAFALSAISLPVLVDQPEIKLGGFKDLGYSVLSGYIFLSVWVVARFYKVIRIFVKLAR